MSPNRVLPALLGLVLVGSAAAAQFPGTLDPAAASFSGDPGDCFAEHKVAHLEPPLPPTDVLLVIDLTGSMGATRDQLITYMEDIVDALPPLVGDVAFGVAHLRDHPGIYTSCGYSSGYGGLGDAPFTLTQPVTTSNADVLAAVAALPAAGGGGDIPEAYSTALQMAIDSPSIGWRPASRRLVMLFLDALPHDCAPGTCLGVAAGSLGKNPGPDGVMPSSDDLGILEIMDRMTSERMPLLVVEASGGVAEHAGLPDWTYWDCWASMTGGLAVSVGADGTGTSGETLADIVVTLLRSTLDRCPLVELVAQAGYESWLASATPTYTDVAAPATLEFDLQICIPPGTPPGVHQFLVFLACLGGANASQTLTIEVGGCACASPTLVPGTIATCFPDAESARLAALAATTVVNGCVGDAVIAATASGGCDGLVTVTSTHPCGNHAITHPVRIDGTAPSLSGLPGTATARCDAVPAAPAVDASDECDGPSSPAYAEIRIDGPCPDEYELRRTWSAVDSCGNAVSETRSVFVSDGDPPVLSGVPADATVECDAVPPPASPSASDGCDGAPVITLIEIRTDGRCPGEWELERVWTATDRCGNAATATQLVRVQDTTPPIIDPAVTTFHCLWPPRHRVRTYGRSDFAPSLHDACSGPITWAFSGCLSDQPDDGLGDGHTSGDCVVSADGSSVIVRSERQGMRPGGRTYSVAAVATDACGNASDPATIGFIHVPHDQSEHPPCERSP